MILYETPAERASRKELTDACNFKKLKKFETEFMYRRFINREYFKNLREMVLVGNYI